MEEAATGLRERKRERTRQAIADAALELFARQGFHATTLPQIAEAADVSPRTVSGYFPAKEDLAFPYADERIAALEQRLRGAPAGETAAEALRRGSPRWSAATRPRRRAPAPRAVIDADEACAPTSTATSNARRPRSPRRSPPTSDRAGRARAADRRGRHRHRVRAARPRPGSGDTRALEALDRALVFIGGGIGALRDESAERGGDRARRGRGGVAVLVDGQPVREVDRDRREQDHQHADDVDDRQLVRPREVGEDRGSVCCWPLTFTITSSKERERREEGRGEVGGPRRIPTSLQRITLL